MKKVKLEDYIPLVGEATIEEIKLLAQQLKGARIQHINSTKTGGGVAEILNQLVPLMNEIGLEVEWDVIEGTEEFFDLTKSFHVALHGARTRITQKMFQIYKKMQVVNQEKIDKNADFVILHDPQPLGLSEFRQREKSKWIWCCHIDISEADTRVWRFLSPLVDLVDGAIFHIPQFTKADLDIPQYVMPPFIDPFSDKNRDLRESEIYKFLKKYGFSTDERFILQVSRFDKLKDPLGALQAFKIVQKSFNVPFVYIGNFAPDDPPGKRVYEEFVQEANKIPGVKVIANPDPNDLVVNAFQRSASVVLQKSIREGFGLVVTEAMWKKQAVIGGDTGGIRYQIVDEATGFLVNTVEGAAFWTRQLLSNPKLATLLGEQAYDRVRANFLPPHYLRHLLCVLLSAKHPGRGVTCLNK
ncbi:glycosyltransferase [candidate division WOR-3 bacterium]|nr:glycosyltransferase [candidate division WOR-3 bacterium]